MKEIITNKNIFDFPKSDEEAVCVTTNGMVKSNGHAVMGAGIAKEADELFNVSLKLGSLLRYQGNQPYDLGVVEHHSTEYRLFTFPTKDCWRDRSDIGLIIFSAKKLMQMCNDYNITKCYIPAVGCGLGGLKWNVVKSILSNILDDRFIAIIKP